MDRQSLSLQAGFLLTCLLLSSCGGEPLAYESSQEMKPGPGLFSGKNGEFILLRSDKTQEAKPDPKQGEQQITGQRLP